MKPECREWMRFQWQAWPAMNCRSASAPPSCRSRGQHAANRHSSNTAATHDSTSSRSVTGASCACMSRASCKPALVANHAAITNRRQRRCKQLKMHQNVVAEVVARSAAVQQCLGEAGARHSLSEDFAAMAQLFELGRSLQLRAKVRHRRCLVAPVNVELRGNATRSASLVFAARPSQQRRTVAARRSGTRAIHKKRD